LYPSLRIGRITALSSKVWKQMFIHFVQFATEGESTAKLFIQPEAEVKAGQLSLSLALFPRRAEVGPGASQHFVRSHLTVV
jgi:hypothetical protein